MWKRISLDNEPVSGKNAGQQDGSAPSSDIGMQSTLKGQADREGDAGITAIPRRRV